MIVLFVKQRRIIVIYSQLTNDYLEYIQLKQYFKSLPKWQLALMNAGKSDKPITLAPTDSKTAKECLERIQALPVSFDPDC